MGFIVAPSIGCVGFELFLPLPTATVVAMSRAAVSVSMLAARAAPTPDVHAFHLASSIVIGGKNDGLSS